MNASLLILRVCAAPSQQRLRRSSVTAALQPSTQLVASLLKVLLAATRGGTRRHLEGGRALRAASASSQQHQLRRSSSSRRRQCPATIGQPLEWAAPRIMFRRHRHRDMHTICLFSGLIILKSLGHSPDRKNNVFGGLKLGSGVGWRSDNCHFGGVRGGSPAKKIFGLRLCGTHFLSLC